MNPIGDLNLGDPITVPPVQPEPTPPTTTPTAPNRFIAALGRVGSLAGSVLLPGFGGLAGRMLEGVTSGLANDPSQYLMLQERIQAQARAYEAASSVLKAKHDAAMDCLRNISH